MEAIGESAMSGSRRERNQQLFHEVSHRIREVGDGFDLSGREKLDLICECADTGCSETLTLTFEDYDCIPRGGRWFLIKPGHEASHQRVIVRTDGYVLVEDPTRGDAGGSSVVTAKPTRALLRSR